MAKNKDDFDIDDEELLDDESLDDGEGEGEESEEELVPQIRDYSDRRVLIWEEDEARRTACFDVLSDLLVGAAIKAVATEAEAMEQIEADDWDTFVVDFYTEGVSESDFIKRVNNYPGSILVALSMGPLTLPDERDPSKTECLRRLFDIERVGAQLHA